MLAWTATSIKEVIRYLRMTSLMQFFAQNGQYVRFTEKIYGSLGFAVVSGRCGGIFGVQPLTVLIVHN